MGKLTATDCFKNTTSVSLHFSKKWWFCEYGGSWPRIVNNWCAPYVLFYYRGAKEQTVKEHKDMQLLSQSNNNHLLPAKPKISRIAGLVKK
jgi:hypothetical protein